MSEDPNREVIEEFRGNAGTVDRAMGGYFKGKALLILHTTGMRTGRERIAPLMYLEEGDRRFVFATKGGAPTHPHWFHNLKANPDVRVETGTGTYRAMAIEVTGPERDRIYAAQASAWPQFVEYERKTGRTIPVVALERAG